MRGNLLLAAAEAVRLLQAEGAGGMELALRLLVLVLFQLALVCEPALLSRLTGRW